MHINKNLFAFPDLPQGRAHSRDLEHRKWLDQPQPNDQIRQQAPTSTKAGTRAPNIPLATPVDKRTNGKVPKNKALIGGDCSAEVTAARRDMARVREGDPLPENAANCEHIAIIQKHVARQVVQTLHEMGVQDPELEVHDWTSGHFRTVLQFAAACDFANLPLQWNNDQVIAFLDMIDAKHYAVTIIDAFWGNLKRIAKALGKSVTKGQRMYFEAVRDNGKSAKDDRLPVSRELLIQLCAGADQVLKGVQPKTGQGYLHVRMGFLHEVERICG